jgi:hypothetical protein
MYGKRRSCARSSIPVSLGVSSAEPGTKKCPFCAEDIRAEAVRCRYCGSDLAAGPVGIASTPGRTPPIASAPARTAVAEFNSRRDFERWLAAAGDSVEVINTSTTKRWSLWSGFLGGAKSYTVTYRDHRPEAAHRSSPFPWKGLLIAGALALLWIAISSLPASPASTATSLTTRARTVTLPPARYRADQVILPPEQFPFAGYVVRQDEGDSSGGWSRVFTPAGRDDAGIGVAIHIVPETSSPDSFFTIYAAQRCAVAYAASATTASDAVAPEPRLGDRDRVCVYGYASGPATLAYRSITDRYLVDVVVLGANGVSATQQMDRARVVMQTQLIVIQRLPR